MSETDKCMICGNTLVLVKMEWMSYWRHIKMLSGVDKHKPVALKDFVAEKRAKERYCYSEHPDFSVVFCRLKPNHEGNHRSYGGLEWEQKNILKTSDLKKNNLSPSMYLWCQDVKNFYDRHDKQVKEFKERNCIKKS